MALGGRGGSGGAAPGAAAMAAVGEERREPERDGGCEHYRRGCLLRVRRRRERGGPRRGAVRALSSAVPLQAPCCGKLYPCRLCHDGAEEHRLDRFRVAEVQCTRCRLLQKVRRVEGGGGSAAAGGRRRHFGRGRAALS